MPSRLLKLSTVLLSATLTAGCNGTPANPTDSADGSKPAPATATPIDVRPVDYASLQKFLADHRGQPVVLDVWSTSCDPCIRELPKLAEFHRDYADRGVVCATLNIDYTGAEDTTPEDAKEEVLSILTTLGVDVHNLYSTMPDRQLFQQELFKQNRVYAVPVIFVFDQSGDVVQAMTGGEESQSPYEEVRSVVDALLKPQKSEA